MVPSYMWGIDTVATGYKLNDSTTRSVEINAWSNCKALWNNSTTKDYFIPTKTSGEWTAFLNNTPSDITKYNCPVVDCVGSWQPSGSGSSCAYSGLCPSSDACGNLFTTGQTCNRCSYSSTYNITTNAQNGGLACPYAQGATGGTVYCYTAAGSFLADTLIAMADGTFKVIQNIIVGDQVLGANGAINDVVQLKPRFHTGQVYGINGKSVFATGSHPFMTIDGWKAFDDVEARKIHPELDIQLISVGDTLVRADGKKETILTISSEYQEVQVYNFEVTGERDYYADGYLVHNK